MMTRYILLDEILLEIILNEDGEKMIFDSEEKARAYAEENLNSWRIIDISWGD